MNPSSKGNGLETSWLLNLGSVPKIAGHSKSLHSTIDHKIYKQNTISDSLGCSTLSNQPPRFPSRTYLRHQLGWMSERRSKSPTKSSRRTATKILLTLGFWASKAWVQSLGAASGPHATHLVCFLFGIFWLGNKVVCQLLTNLDSGSG